MLLCQFHQQGLCRSCDQISLPIHEQLANKVNTLKSLLADLKIEKYLTPVFGDEIAFRNKAKMVVLGAAHQPILGIQSPNGNPISLCDCPLYPKDMQQLLHRLEKFVQQAGIPPYKVEKQKGELKYILLTRSQISGEYLLRFVLKSHQSIFRIERELPQLLNEYPKIKVVSVNIQPIHMARLEGEEEIFLTENTRLKESFNHIPLFIRPKSFFQTNPKVAAKLYQTAKDWVNESKPQHIWDLFCGVGGFGLHCASKNVNVTGIEIESEAIACAKLSAQELKLTNLDFSALDSTDFALGKNAQQVPDVVIVNPPRCGIGEQLCQSLTQFAPKTIIYSSCNPKTLAKDLKTLSGYRIKRVQIFDMFPHSSHFEVLALLERANN